MLVSEIPNKQRAMVKTNGEDPKKVTTLSWVGVPQPGPDQILVKITWSGLCGTDKSFLQDAWAPFGFSMQPGAQGISGHEGVGVVVAVGDDMHARWKIGDRAGIKWISKICGECEFCRLGDEVHCRNQTNSGFNSPGTFQEYCVVDGSYTTRIPTGVSDREAAPILCGGVTAYAACKKSGVKSGQWIVIPGAGGGLGHLAIQYARAMGMRVIGIDTGEEKRQLCERLGAEIFIDFRKIEDIAQEIRRVTGYGAHAVLVIAATKEAFAMAPNYLRPKGTLVSVGLPTDTSIVAGATPGLLAFTELTIVGSLAADSREVEEAFDLCAKGLVRVGPAMKIYKPG